MPDDVEVLTLNDLKPFLIDRMEDDGIDAIVLGRRIYHHVLPTLGFSEYGKIQPDDNTSRPNRVAVFDYDEKDTLVEQREFNRTDVQWSEFDTGIPEFVKFMFPPLDGLFTVYRRNMPIFDPLALADVFERFEAKDIPVGAVVCNPSDITALKDGLKNNVDLRGNSIWGAQVKSSEDVNRGELYVIAQQNRGIPSQVAVLMKHVEEF